MARMQDRNKWAFWGFVAAAAALVCLPSTILLDAFRRYRRFAEGVDPAVLRQHRVRFVPHDRSGGEAPDIDFVEFRHKAPKAKTVDLIGDFNAWNPGTVKLSKRDGAWETLIPLPKGRYRYAFLVDGKRELDPSAKETETVNGEDASVRVVK